MGMQDNLSERLARPRRAKPSEGTLRRDLNLKRKETLALGPEGYLRAVDKRVRGGLALALGGQSPWAAYEAWADWAFHFSLAPVRQVELILNWQRAMRAIISGSKLTDQAEWALKPVPEDRRFRHEAWARWPFNLLAQMHLALEAQWHEATSGVPGVSERHEQRVRFMGEFLLNALAPVNFAATNPEVIEQTIRSGGRNFAAGARLLSDDSLRLLTGQKLRGTKDWEVGRTMAVTQGDIIYRNELFELICYRPTTSTVYSEPILITPAWIMKYYILDLTPEDSLVRWLVDSGFTVFMISWKNPDGRMRETSFDDYRTRGVIEAIHQVHDIFPARRIHAVGYCLGGTILAIAAAALCCERKAWLSSLTLLAAQTDFEDAGELLLFIDESQLALLEAMMDRNGFLDAKNMSSAFYALRSNEMVFARLVERYLLGTEKIPQALDAWLADPTRMPARMHSEYLRKLFLENAFSHGALEVDGRSLAIKDIDVPTFALGAERDHIAPWRSVYKIELFGDVHTTFVLTGGGHNSSVVSPPGKEGSYYYVGGGHGRDGYIDPDRWLAGAVKHEGSWWPKWREWLAEHSCTDKVAPPAPGIGKSASVLGPAPGTYVLET